MNNADSPAMPVTDEQGMPFNSVPSEPSTIGLTKREEFAKAAMQALAANSGVVSVFGAGRQIASEAVRYADELLAELERTS